MRPRPAHARPSNVRLKSKQFLGQRIGVLRQYRGCDRQKSGDVCRLTHPPNRPCPPRNCHCREGYRCWGKREQLRGPGRPVAGQTLGGRQRAFQPLGQASRICAGCGSVVSTLFQPRYRENLCKPLRTLPYAPKPDLSPAPFPLPPKPANIRRSDHNIEQ